MFLHNIIFKIPYYYTCTQQSITAVKPAQLLTVDSTLSLAKVLHSSPYITQLPVYTISISTYKYSSLLTSYIIQHPFRTSGAASLGGPVFYMEIDTGLLLISEGPRTCRILCEALQRISFCWLLQCRG